MGILTPCGVMAVSGIILIGGMLQLNGEVSSLTVILGAAAVLYLIKR